MVYTNKIIQVKMKKFSKSDRINVQYYSKKKTSIKLVKPLVDKNAKLNILFVSANLQSV